MLLLMKPEAAHFLNTWDMEVRYATNVLLCCGMLSLVEKLTHFILRNSRIDFGQMQDRLCAGNVDSWSGVGVLFYNLSIDHKST